MAPPCIQFVKKLTLTPADMTQADADAVFDAGWDEGLHDAIAITARMCFMQRIVEGHGFTPMTREVARERGETRQTRLCEPLSGVPEEGLSRLLPTIWVRCGRRSDGSNASPVHDTTVVPHHHVAVPPFMGPFEAIGGRMRPYCVKKLLIDRQPDDPRIEAPPEKGIPASLRMRPHERMSGAGRFHRVAGFRIGIRPP